MLLVVSFPLTRMSGSQECAGNDKCIVDDRELNSHPAADGQGIQREKGAEWLRGCRTAKKGSRAKAAPNSRDGIQLSACCRAVRTVPIIERVPSKRRSSSVDIEIGYTI